MATPGGHAPSPEGGRLRLIAVARAGDLEGVREAIAEGGDVEALGIELRSAVSTALEYGDAAWFKRQAARVVRAEQPPHPHEARASALAESLGAVSFVSTSVDETEQPVAWGFYVGEIAALKNKALAIGVSIRRPTLVLVPVVSDHVLTGTVIAKTIARVSAPELEAGATVCPPSAEYGREVQGSGYAARFQLLDPRSVSSALAYDDAVFARPIPGRSIRAQASLEKLERCAHRLTRLVALEAPEVMIEQERTLVRRTYAELVGAGWSVEADPLAAAIHSIVRESVAG